jgi:predicted PhzF superfamily epimerase YddE/YHI9
MRLIVNVPVVSGWRTASMTYLVETDTEQTVRSMHPDLHLLAQLPARSVILTSRSTTDVYDFVSCYFAPRLGITDHENGFTNSNHCLSFHHIVSLHPHG